MHTPLLLYLIIPAAYLLGSVPTGVLVTRACGGVDPRKAGSGNIGATNVGRTSGKSAGILTLAGDVLKGAIPVLIAKGLGLESLLTSLTGLAAFLGHLFPIFLGFRGGKGVATALGVMIVVSPAATILSALVFALTAAVKRHVSLASMTAAASLPIFLSFIHRDRVYLPLAVAVAILIIFKHKDNIKRLANGTENRIGGPKG
ncbi:MAG TPA: glycerol-3-phosphate 1-O-acyltransferase PlsY [Thermodesulfobacteriota bacterium]